MSASQYHWTKYTPEKLEQVYTNQQAKERGTLLHDFASNAIQQRIKLAPLKKAINKFVNDAIGFGMESEQVLYYSDNCFGTADAILFKDNLLRIHDLKTGVSKPSFRQLDIYAALFCHEYNVNPNDIQIEERIYQNNGYETNIPDPNDIIDIMDKIVEFDIIIDKMRSNSL